MNAQKKIRLAPVPDATTQRLILGTDVHFENSDRELVKTAETIPKNGTVHATFIRPDGTTVAYFGATNESLVRKIIVAHAALLGAVLEIPEPSLEPTPTSTRSKRRSSTVEVEPPLEPVAPVVAAAVEVEVEDFALEDNDLEEDEDEEDDEDEDEEDDEED